MTDSISYYVRDDKTGAIVRSGTSYETDELRTIAAGQTFIEVGPGDIIPSPRLHMVDLATGKFVAKPASNRIDKTTKAAELQAACTKALQADFLSKALGSPNWYPTGPTDQTNMIHATVAGGMLMCRSFNAWALQPHTVDQAKAVIADFVKFKDGIRQNLANKLATLSAATTQAQVDAITW